MKYPGNLNKQLQKQVDHYTTTIASNPNDSKAYVMRGMLKFKMGEIYGSITDFDTAEKLEPTITPYLWQRGISYYYADKFAEGAKQFETDLQVNSKDIEETVWRYLCISRFHSIDEARKSLLPIKDDPRLVMQRVYELYVGNSSIEDVLAVGNPFNKRPKFYSHLYVGLYFEAVNEMDKAQDYITKAADKYQINDYMWYLACVHKNLRGWE
ncbi:MAG: hypothetical protein AAF378_02790 [Cyanobacteria bacterium P01_A01_bin.84]